ncbi:MAG: response regulator [Thermodesulfobacteriota bacterium]
MQKNIKILIAEDIKPTQKLYDAALSDNFFDKKFADNGETALKYYKEFKPDIILLDIYMPIMTGFTLLKKIRHEFKDKQTKIMVVTSRNYEEDVRGCAEFGIDGYLVKPVNTEMLEKKILDIYLEQT